MLFGFSDLVIGPLSLGLFMSLVRFHARDVAARPLPAPAANREVRSPAA